LINAFLVGSARITGGRGDSPTAVVDPKDLSAIGASVLSGLIPLLFFLV